MSAAINGQLKVVEFLLANGADMEAKTAGGEMASMLAVSNNHWHVAEKLI